MAFGRNSYASIPPAFDLRAPCCMFFQVERVPHSQLIGVLEPYGRQIADIALALRELILEEAPDASESIYRVWLASSAPAVVT
jgi:hypothetical protein